MDVSIVVPCYNEVDNIPKIKNELMPVLLDLAKTQSVEMVFVDDGSSDGTLPALNQLRDENKTGITIKVEAHGKNRGVGHALRTGFAAATGEKIVTTDSDGTYKFSNIPALLACLSNEVQIITASPYHPRGGVVGVPANRLVLSKGSSFLYRVLVDWRIHTYTSLFRAYSRQVIEDVPFSAGGFLAGTELMVKAMLKGYRVDEFPDVLYRRAYGTSKTKLVRTILAHLRFQGSVLLHRLHLISLVEPRGSQKTWQKPQSQSL